MKRILWGISLLVLIADSANAALISRLSGAAYYDDVLDITWTADANLAASNTFGVQGIVNSQMSWTTAQNWIAGMNAANYLGTNDWRLAMTVQPDAGCSNEYVPGQNYGFGCTGSEMGHLYHVDGISFSNPGPFSNIQNVRYYSDTEYAPSSATLAWTFRFDDGFQSRFSKGDLLSAWAVRSGDIAAVPEPGASWLLAMGFVALGAKLKRRVRGAATEA